MASVPVASSPASSPPETLEQRFRRLAAEWKKAVALQSSSRVRESHPAYQEIIGLGPAVVPLMLRDLEKNETHWFSALQRLTGARPVSEDDAGNVPRMVEAWLRWARENGQQW
jgi:hypothetical protein